MVITCPNCRTRFQIRPSSLGEKGRNVRCSSCGNRWFVEPFPEPAAPAPPAPEPVPTSPAPAPEPAAAAPPPPPEPTPLSTAPPRPSARRATSRGSGIAGWLVLAVVALALVGAVVARNAIVATVPAALPIYRLVGLPVTLELGLAFRDLGSSRRDTATGSTVLVTGTIVNTTGREVRVPRLRIALLDQGSREIESGLHDPPQRSLPPQGTTRFEIALENPPDEARDFTITFAETP